MKKFSKIIKSNYFYGDDVKKAVVLMNMGGARSKEELREFLYNMFKDKRIISSSIRHLVAPLMMIFRSNTVWKNYEKIGGSNIYLHTQSLVEKVQKHVGKEIDVLYAMKYTQPRVRDISLEQYDEVMFFALYPHFSSTTIASSYDDVDMYPKNKTQRFTKINQFFKDEDFNALIIKSIKKEFIPDSHLIFSAHGLPISIDKKDNYSKYIHLHVKIIKDILKKENIKFKKIHIAYQSKVGPVEWLKPSLEVKLKEIPKNSSVIIYPISFVIDNSETDFELSIEYKQLAKNLGLNYKVCKVQNDSDEFTLYLSDKIKKEWNHSNFS